MNLDRCLWCSSFLFMCRCDRKERPAPTPQRDAQPERENAELREPAEKAERALQQAHVEATLEDVDRTTTEQRLRDELSDLRARLARYEAPGPALLYVECGDHDVVCESDVDTPCICAVGVAYREQHARCVAVVRQLLLRRLRGGATEHGVELAIAALTDGLKPAEKTEL